MTLRELIKALETEAEIFGFDDRPIVVKLDGRKTAIIHDIQVDGMLRRTEIHAEEL